MKALLFSPRLSVGAMACLLSGDGVIAYQQVWCEAFIPEMLKPLLASSSPDVILIDALGHKTDADQVEKLLGDRDEQFRLMAEAPNISCLEMPHSFVLLRALRRHCLPGTIIVFFIDDPGLYVTQILLKLGADWVWPHLDNPGDHEDKFAAVIEKLQELQHLQPLQPRLA